MPRVESPEESIADADFVSVTQPHVQLEAAHSTRRAPDLAASTRATNAEPTSANRGAPEPPPAGRHTTARRQDATSDFNACDAGGTHPTTTRAGTFSSHCRLKPEPDHGPRQRRNITSAANFPSSSTDYPAASAPLQVRETRRPTRHLISPQRPDTSLNASRMKRAGSHTTPRTTETKW